MAHQISQETQTSPGKFGARIRARVNVPLLNANDSSFTHTEILSFDHLPDSAEHIMIGFGDWAKQEVPLVRVHSECLTGDVLGSARCDCGPQLEEAKLLLGQEHGILLYLRQEGRGIGLYNKLDTYVLQSQGLDTYQANRSLSFVDDGRDYASAAGMLKAVGKTRIKLLSNNPDKGAQLKNLGIEVIEQRPTSTFANKYNHRYLLAKRIRTAHTLEILP